MHAYANKPYSNIDLNSIVSFLTHTLQILIINLLLSRSWNAPLRTISDKRERNHTTQNLPFGTRKEPVFTALSITHAYTYSLVIYIQLYNACIHVQLNNTCTACSEICSSFLHRFVYFYTELAHCKITKR